MTKSTIMDELRDSRTEYPVMYMELISAKKKLLEDEIDMIFFLEGKDDIKYYKERFDHYLKDKKYTYFYVEGKENVLELRTFLRRKNESTFQIRYIVDKDFDNTATADDLYVTPYYSIENFYISKKVFKDIINVNLSLNKFSKKDEKDYNMILDLYQKRKNEFINALDEVMEFYYYQKINKVKVENIKTVITKKNPLIKVALDKIIKNYDKDRLKKIVENSKELDREDILENDLGIKKDNRKYFYRGKYLIEFLEKFTMLLFQDANEKKNEKRVYFSEKRKNSVNVSGNILGVFSNCSETPSCLIKFLEKANKEKVKKS